MNPSDLPPLPCYLNGEYTRLPGARISVMDRGFIFGDRRLGAFALLQVVAQRRLLHRQGGLGLGHAGRGQGAGTHDGVNHKGSAVGGHHGVTLFNIANIGGKSLSAPANTSLTVAYCSSLLRRLA